MTIQGYFFDLYGTLLVYGDMNRAWSDWLSTFYDLLNAQGMQCTRADFSEACDGFFSAAPPVVARGDQLTVLERRILRLCAAYNHQPGKTELREIADRIAAAWQTHIATDPQAMPVLKQLKQLQKTVGLVSNFDHPPHVRRLLAENGWANIFDTIIISSEVGVKKPDPAIFELALQHAGIAPAQAVYVGDTQDDVTGAIAAGIQPVFITRTDNPTDSSALDFQMAVGQPPVAENSSSNSALMTIYDLEEILTLAT
ncbi:MAG: HAD family hydrolase [Desulfobacterales bacterium]|nr:HAD family hydrolase [Desulfobacterales bacterium]